LDDAELEEAELEDAELVLLLLVEVLVAEVEVVLVAELEDEEVVDGCKTLAVTTVASSPIPHKSDPIAM